MITWIIVYVSGAMVTGFFIGLFTKPDKAAPLALIFWPIVLPIIAGAALRKAFKIDFDV